MPISATARFTPRSDLGRFVPARVTPSVVKSVESALKLIQNSAKIYVPVDTGRLRDSITVETQSTETSCTGTVGPHTDYADFVEFGTGRMRAQAFMRPAYDETKGSIADLFRGQLRTDLNS